MEELLRDGDDADVPRERWQRRCVDVFQHRDTELVHRHLRRQLERFQMSTLPGRRADRAIRMLRGLQSKVPPCVWAAVLRALCDGWTTGARMNSIRGCLFQCGRGQDSLHHYAHCPVVEQLARSRACLAPACAGWKFDDFLLLTPVFDPTQQDLFAVKASRLYATFRATNAACHGDADNAGDIWVQAFREAAAGHSFLAGALRRVRAGGPGGA